MALARLSSQADPTAVYLSGFPNVFGWPVVGQQAHALGQVVDVIYHDDTGEVLALAIQPAGEQEIFYVPPANAEVDLQDMRVTVYRNLSEFPTTPPRAQGRPSLLRTLLSDYGIDDETIDALESAGILNMERLRAITERGGLAPLLGPGRREEARKVERAVREQRL